ncbi:MAG: 3-deoxy-manno-octulosonate cytidylyltransferase [Pirellulaceae bacterium]
MPHDHSAVRLSLRTMIVIPARLHSTRLPEKLLLAETGKPLIQHTYEAVSQTAEIGEVVVATDHASIAEAVRQFGGNVVMTSPDCASGTDRIAEVARSRADIDLFINVQGDEPDISAESILRLHGMLTSRPSISMATLATPIRDAAKLKDPSCVKVVCDDQGQALYFSRAAIPHGRDWDETLLEADPPHFLQHLGIYAYRRDFLLRMAETPPSRLEQLEKLEQLRVLSLGEAIAVGVVDEASIGIDTPADYATFVRKMAS